MQAGALIVLLQVSRRVYALGQSKGSLGARRVPAISGNSAGNFSRGYFPRRIAELKQSGL